jgi:hypothetical protein
MPPQRGVEHDGPTWSGWWAFQEQLRAQMVWEQLHATVPLSEAPSGIAGWLDERIAQEVYRSPW